MGTDRVRIERLSLRVVGLDRDCARSLGREFLAPLQAQLPERLPSRHLARLKVRVQVPVGTPRERLAALVAERIREGLT